MNVPKNHHFYTASVLDFFTDPNSHNFLVYLVKQKKFKWMFPDAVCYQLDLYTMNHEGVSDELRYGLESVWRKSIEDEALPVIRDLDQGKKLNNDTRESLARFIALHLLGHPDTLIKLLQNVNGREWFKLRNIVFDDAAIAKILKETGKSLEQDKIEKMRECFQYGKVEIKYPAERALQEMIKGYPVIVDSLLAADWIICHVPKEAAFITSDNPVVAIKGGSSFKVVTMPLTPRVLVEIHHITEGLPPKVSGAVMTRVGVRHRNILTASNAQRYIISHIESLLRRIVK
jgi:hypothetical protein